MTHPGFVSINPLLRPSTRSVIATGRDITTVTCSQTGPELQTQALDDEPNDTCMGCGHSGGPISGCDGNGRIIGGLGAVVKWWPIKAYRPCPEFLKANKRYKRAGQSLDEIAFGRKSEGDDKSIRERLGGS